MNERTHFFIKNISLTLYSQEGWCWLCVRNELETGTDCYILTQVLLTIAALFSHLGWVAQPWVTEGRKPSVCKLILTLASCPQLTLTATATDSSRLCPGYIFVCRPPASAVLPLIYTGASAARSRVYMLQTVIKCNKSFKKWHISLRNFSINVNSALCRIGL